jgi:hypothetical protein
MKTLLTQLCLTLLESWAAREAIPYVDAWWYVDHTANVRLRLRLRVTTTTSSSSGGVSDGCDA